MGMSRYRLFVMMKRYGLLGAMRRLSSTKSDADKTPLRHLLAGSASFSEREVREPELQWATLPYTRTTSDESPKEYTDPRHTSVILFPGQGTQYIGMGKDLLKFPAAKELYEFASSVVGWNVLRVCTEGPAEELDRHSQTCIVVSSLAALERLREERPAALENARAAAGFSLGELAALSFAGAFPLEQTLRLVELRTEAMRAASLERPGALLTVWFGADANVGFAMLKAREAAQQKGDEFPFCQIANYLFPHCKVIAGSKEALKFLEQSGRQFGIKRTARVPVTGAFHSEAMRPAVPALRAALKLCDVSVPRIPVISSVNALPYRSVEKIRRQLAVQVVNPVRWEQVLHALFARSQGEHFPNVYTVGPGATVRSTLRQVNAKAWDFSMQIDT